MLTFLKTKIANVFIGKLASRFTVLGSGLAHRMHLAVAGVGHHSGIDGVLEQQVRHAVGVANADHVDTALGQLFSQQIHRSIGGGGHQHAPLTPNGFQNSLHQRGGFPRAGRAMDDGHVLGRDDMAHSGQLRVVEYARVKRVVGFVLSKTGLPGAQQRIAQFGQAVAMCAHDFAQGLIHLAVAHLIKSEVNA